jgi:tetratricopeptide (TPR) repeat protein
MPGSAPKSGFFGELRRRNVFRVALPYIVIAWLVIEIAGFLLEQAGAPVWAIRLLAIAFVVGFPVAAVLAWVVQKQPDGRWAIDRSTGQRRIVTAAIVLGILATAGLSWLILPRLADPPVIADYEPLPNSVAILPFAAADSAPHERVVAETLYTALVQGLKQSRELTQVQLRLKERPQDLTAFGRRMRVVALLAGRIKQVSGGTRIEMELLDVGRGRLRWSQAFDWDATDIVETGTAIANGVLEAMDVPAMSRYKLAGTDNRAAYDELLLGHKRLSVFRLEDMAAAIEHFQRAVDLDPAYARAYASLGSALFAYLYAKGPAQEERQALTDRGREALETAVELDDESADAISALGWITSNREIRVQLYERALQVDPNHELSYHRLGWQRWGAGELEEAARLFRKALELDPMDANQHHDLGELLWEMGRADEAMAELNRSIELEPEMPQNFRLLGLIELWSYGRIASSIIQVRKAYALDPKNGSNAGFLAGAYAGLGAREEALSWLERSLQLSPSGGWALNMAYLTHLMLGEEDAAMEYVTQLLELDPKHHRALFFVGRHDIKAGRAQRALERWQRAYPVMIAADEPECDHSNYHVLVAYADNLMLAGSTERATGILQGCLPVIEAISNRLWPEAFLSRSLALLGQKDEALVALREEIVDGNRRIEASCTFDQPEYDFLREEPEFQRLMEIIETDLGQQLERIREMEHNGALPPAAGVDLPLP